MTSSTLFVLAGVAIVILGLSIFGGKGRSDPQGPFICPSCGVRSYPSTKTRGSIFIEIILWLCLIIPGVIYSIWRLTTRHKACPACGQGGVIPVETPRGRKLAQEALPPT